MIISASRRTDIPALYGEWFMNRIKAGYVIVPNPYNINRYYKVNLLKEAVDIIVFWSKNPKPFFKYLEQLNNMGYKYYFQFTITPYDNKIETNLPSKKELIDDFIYLSNKISKEKVIWRYDPIILNNEFTIDYHINSFEKMCKKLSNYTNRCIISFVDNYKNVSARMGYIVDSNFTEDNMNKLAKGLSKIADKYSVELYTCSEKFNLDKYGIKHGACIDKNLIEKILDGDTICVKDKNQRRECLCLESIEIGTYNTCNNGCKYCYALQNVNDALSNIRKHNPETELLVGQLPSNAITTNRKDNLIINNQLKLF